MKRIRIIAVLVLLAIVGIELGESIRGAWDGWNEAGNEITLGGYATHLSLRADSPIAADSVQSSITGTYLPYQLNSVSVYQPSRTAGGHLTVTKVCVQIALFLTACFALYGIYCLIRMVFSVTRHGEVFTDRNVRRIRFFTYSLILCCLAMEVDAWMSYSEVASQVQFEGYTVAPYSLKYNWTFFLVFALLTEIFAAGVQIKKEQDLTI